MSDSFSPSRQSESAQVGVRDPNEEVAIRITRAQAWDIYDELVRRAVALECAEDEAHCSLGSRRFRDAANKVRTALA